ncbi:MAG TPA: TetR/AcrR family transcriptional regulator [Blastocatellia bacterium]|nr:TetR/AcrR family transcriptional regulator [Blastocatellia bacterium]
MASPISERTSAGRMSAEERRNQIVVIAAELFSQKGFRGTTTKEVAERAGVSEAIIFRHFATKDELYAAILSFKIQQAGEHLTTQLTEAARRKDDRAFFGSLAFEMLEFHCKDEAFIRLLLYSALEGHDLSAFVFHSAARDFKQRIHHYIQQRIADGAFRQVNPAVAARAFVGMVLHQAEMRTIFKDTDDLKLSNKQFADRFVEIFLAGICQPKAR